MKKKQKISKSAVDSLTHVGTIRPVRIGWIKARRERMGMTLAEAAKRAGMNNHVQWHKVESGKLFDPHLSTILRMAKALRCNPMELMNWKEWRVKR